MFLFRIPLLRLLHHDDDGIRNGNVHRGDGDVHIQDKLHHRRHHRRRGDDVHGDDALPPLRALRRDDDSLSR